MSQLSQFTMVSSPALRSSERWRVYRLATENSVYELEVQAESSGRGRRCVVLTCVKPEARAGENYEDSSPELDERSLFEFSPMDWIGKCLTVGTASTSRIQSVDFVNSVAAPSALARIQSQKLSQSEKKAPRAAPREEQPAPQRPGWSPFPEGYVEMAEAAANVLRNVCHRYELFAAIEGNAQLEHRMKVALAECRLMLDALLRRV